MYINCIVIDAQCSSLIFANLLAICIKATFAYPHYKERYKYLNL